MDGRAGRGKGCALEMTALICATIVVEVVAVFLMLVVASEAG